MSLRSNAQMQWIRFPATIWLLQIPITAFLGFLLSQQPSTLGDQPVSETNSSTMGTSNPPASPGAKPVSRQSFDDAILDFFRNRNQVFPQRGSALGPRNNWHSRRSSGFDDSIIELGDPTQGETLGLTITVIPNHRQHNNYERWYVYAKRADGLPFDRDNELTLLLDEQQQGYSPKVRHTIQLTQGETESFSSFLVPRNASLGSVQNSTYNYGYLTEPALTTFQRGRRIPGLSVGGSVYVQSSWTNTSTSGKKLTLLTEESAEILDEDQTLFANKPNNQSINSTLPKVTSSYQVQPSTVNQSVSPVSFATVYQDLKNHTIWATAFNDTGVLEWLPKDWRETANLAMICIDGQDVESISEEITATLRTYIRCGGILVIANSFEGLDLSESLEKWLKQNFYPSNYDISPPIFLDKTNPDEGYYIPYGIGGIAVSESDAYSIVRTFENKQESPGRRLGAFPSSRDRLTNHIHFFNWSILKGVQPPILFFTLGVFAFAGLFAPYLVWYSLNKAKRPIWILVFFPPAALLFSGILYGYSMLKDGFGSTARIRSVTFVDNRTGEGVAISRQTYFSSSNVTEVSFRHESEVWPIPTERSSDYRYEVASSPYELRFEKDRQIYRGFLPPRSQAQWIVTTPVSKLNPFEWISTGDESNPTFSAKNNSNDHWQIGLICDENGKVYVTKNHPPNQTLPLHKVETLDELEEVSKLVSESLPISEYPPGFGEFGTNSIAAWFQTSVGAPRQSRIVNSSSGNYYDLFNDPIEGILRPFCQFKFHSMPHHFLLIVDQAPHIDRPHLDHRDSLKSTTEYDSQHVVLGVW